MGLVLPALYLRRHAEIFKAFTVDEVIFHASAPRVQMFSLEDMQNNWMNQQYLIKGKSCVRLTEALISDQRRWRCRRLE
ncbi:hypothetical protein EGJ27_02830 [Pseudomonas sp. v388]|nr:hypothetical protein EGJ27_02830 [Pseudomonas sp. v388]